MTGRMKFKVAFCTLKGMSAAMQPFSALHVSVEGQRMKNAPSQGASCP
jgi:hypothetical protein